MPSRYAFKYHRRCIQSELAFFRDGIADNKDRTKSVRTVRRPSVKDNENRDNENVPVKAPSKI